MAHDPSASVDLTVEPDLDARHAVSFPVARRGYDPHQVDHVVQELAAEIDGLRATVVELREREADLLVALDAADDRTRAIERRAEALESELAAAHEREAQLARQPEPSDVTAPDEPDAVVDGSSGAPDRPGAEHQAGVPSAPVAAAPDVATMVGEETVRIVEAARHAAVEIGARARDDAERVVADAREEARVIRADAEVQLLNRTREADDAVAARLLEAADAVQEAETRAEAIVADAFTEAATLVLRAREEAEAAAVEGAKGAQELIDAATATRDDLLADLVRRRKVLRRQVEQLEAGRVRLRAAFEVVEGTLGDTTAELDRAPVEARDAALAAAARADEAPDPELAEAIAELGADPAIAIAGPDPDAGGEPVAAPSPTSGPASAPDDASSPTSEPSSAADTTEPVGPVEPAPDPPDQRTADATPEPELADAAVAPAPAIAAADELVDDPELEAARSVLAEESDPAAPAADEGRRRRRRAPDPVEFEGRWSSAVRVLPPGEPTEDPTPATGIAGAGRPPRRTRSASDLFARLRADESHQPSLFDTDGPAGSNGHVDADAASDVDADADADADVDADVAVAVAVAVAVDVAADTVTPDAPETEPEVDATGAEPAVDPEASADLEAAWVARRDAAAAPALRALRRRLKATLADDEDGLLEAIRRSDPLPDSIDSLRDARARRDDLALALQASLATAAAAGAELVTADPTIAAASVGPVSTDADATTIEVDDLDAIALDLADAVVGPLDERLERSLARYHRTIAEDPEGVDHEGALATLISSVKAAYRARRGVQVQVPTEDAVLRAGHRGLVAALEPGTPLRWVVVAPAPPSKRGAASAAAESDDEPAGPGSGVGCPSCVAVADVAAGDPFGHGPVLPPARSGCRCAVAPVVAVVPRRH